MDEVLSARLSIPYGYRGMDALEKDHRRLVIDPMEGNDVASLASRESKDRVRQAVNIVDLIGGYVTLRRQGRNFAGICPFHDDSKPSLQVNAERQSWRCWVCAIGGDVFSFLMQKEGISFPEALAMLAEKAEIPVEPVPESKFKNGRAKSRSYCGFVPGLNSNTTKSSLKVRAQQRPVTMFSIAALMLRVPVDFAWVTHLPIGNG